jgi:hypothetical protein
MGQSLRQGACGARAAASVHTDGATAWSTIIVDHRADWPRCGATRASTTRCGRVRGCSRTCGEGGDRGGGPAGLDIPRRAAAHAARWTCRAEAPRGQCPDGRRRQPDRRLPLRLEREWPGLGGSPRERRPPGAGDAVGGIDRARLGRLASWQGATRSGLVRRSGAPRRSSRRSRPWRAGRGVPFEPSPDRRPPARR